jgi:hypothetical protein
MSGLCPNCEGPLYSERTSTYYFCPKGENHEPNDVTRHGDVFIRIAVGYVGVQSVTWARTLKKSSTSGYAKALKELDKRRANGVGSTTYLGGMAAPIVIPTLRSTRGPWHTPCKDCGPELAYEPNVGAIHHCPNNHGYLVRFYDAGFKGAEGCTRFGHGNLDETSVVAKAYSSMMSSTVTGLYEKAYQVLCNGGGTSGTNSDKVCICTGGSRFCPVHSETRAPSQCKCSMLAGCTCGVFKAEMAAKKAGVAMTTHEPGPSTRQVRKILENAQKMATYVASPQTLYGQIVTVSDVVDVVIPPVED